MTQFPQRRPEPVWLFVSKVRLDGHRFREHEGLLVLQLRFKVTQVLYGDGRRRETEEWLDATVEDVTEGYKTDNLKERLL